MAIQNRTILKGYFNTGDQPTEAQFHDLIDSQINLTDGGTVTGNISSSTAITASVLAAGSLTLDLNIESAAATDATFYSINGRRVEVRSQLQGAVAADTGFTLELRNTSVKANSWIAANVIGGDGGILTGSVVSANVVAASTASLNFFNTGAAIANDATFTASVAIF